MPKFKLIKIFVLLGSVAFTSLANAYDTLIIFDSFPSQTDSFASSINNTGQVAGYYETSTDVFAVLWNGTTPTILGSGQAVGINNIGQIVGNDSNGKAIVWNGTTPNYLNSNETRYGATAINNLGQVVGITLINSGWQVTLWNDTTPSYLGDLGGLYHQNPSSINDIGQITGWGNTQLTGGEVVAVILNGLTTTILGSLGGTFSEALSINNFGQVVGFSDYDASSPQDSSRATLWNGADVIDLNTLINPDLGFTLLVAQAINDKRQVVGYGMYGNRQMRAFKLNTSIKVKQTINPITFLPMIVKVGGLATLSASATSNLLVAFASTTPSVCTVTGSTVTAISAGSCVITANQVGDANYDAAPQISKSITIDKGTQTITFSNLPIIIVTVTSNIHATASSNLLVVFASTTPSVCTVTGSTVTAKILGSCIITADQVGGANYDAAPQVTKTIAVNKKSQTITFGVAPSITNGTGTVSASATSNILVAFSSTTPSVCTVTGSNVTGKKLGSCIIAANQAGNSIFNAAPQVTQTIAVNKQPQTISFASAPTLLINKTGHVSATASSGLTLAYKSLTTGSCTVTGSTVTGKKLGSCIIAANQAGNSIFNAAPQVTQTIAVNKQPQ